MRIRVFISFTKNVHLNFYHVTYCMLCVDVFSTGSSLSDQVHQTPADMYKKPGETAQVNCSHNIQNYYTILWYRQSENQQMQLLGYISYAKGYPEPGVTVQMGGSANQGSFTVKNVEPGDNGVYFCAASAHTLIQILVQLHKNLSLMPHTSPVYCLTSLCSEAVKEDRTTGADRSLCAHVTISVSSLLGSPHNVFSSYNVILWYKSEDSNLTLIGYVYYKNPTIEEQFQKHFNVTGDGSARAHLHILKLRQPEDSGMYFCAASRHSD
uniref:Ig-like domain-containing protein n=1 Tax=Myripristis murdjan TaxID=586833 RepID=A0A667YGN1_9TELE